MKRVKPPRPGRALMMRKRLAEAQALLYAPTDAQAAERLTEEWLAGVELGWVKPPQLPLQLDACSPAAPAPRVDMTARHAQKKKFTSPGFGSSLGGAHEGNLGPDKSVHSGGRDY